MFIFGAIVWLGMGAILAFIWTAQHGAIWDKYPALSAWSIVLGWPGWIVVLLAAICAGVAIEFHDMVKTTFRELNALFGLTDNQKSARGGETTE